MYDNRVEQCASILTVYKSKLDIAAKIYVAEFSCVENCVWKI